VRACVRAGACRRALSKQVISYSTSGKPLNKQRFKYAFVSWQKQAKERALVMRMLVDARAAAIRHRDELMAAIETGDHDSLSQLLRKLLPSAPDKRGTSRGRESREQGQQAEDMAGPVMLSMVDDLRVVSNLILSHKLSKEEALDKVLEYLSRWRAELSHRHAFEKSPIKEPYYTQKRPTDIGAPQMARLTIEAWMRSSSPRSLFSVIGLFIGLF
jgi:hypothetical protein